MGRLLLFLLFGLSAFLGPPGLALPPGPSEGPPPRDGSSSHSMRYFYTAVSEPDPGMPHFIAVGYVDDQLIEQYDSDGQRLSPKTRWAEDAARDVSHYWDTYTNVLKNTEAVFRDDLVTLRGRYNQTGGFHTWQLMYGCELREDGSKGGYWQYAYSGKDYISLDKETLTWTAADVQGQITKRKWEAEPTIAQSQKAYLEEECIEWLQTRYLKYGKEVLLRTETPVGKVTRQAIGEGREALNCQAHGFYPKDIETTWRKGKEILEHETFRRNIAPNSDGTFHSWLSIEIDPKERDLYRCHVDHASLPKPLVLAFEEPGVNVRLTVGRIVGVVAVSLVVGIAILIKKRQKKPNYEKASQKRQKKPDYEKTPTSDKSSDSSTTT